MDEMNALILYEDHSLDKYVGIIIEKLKKIDFHISAKNISEIGLKHCIGCYSCWWKTPGRCIVEGKANEIIENILGAKLLVVVSMVSFGGYSSTIKKPLEHLLPIVMPNFKRGKYLTRHVKRYREYPDFFGVGIITNKNNEEVKIFESLVRENSYNMHSNNSYCLIVNKKDGFNRINREFGKIIKFIVR